MNGKPSFEKTIKKVKKDLKSTQSTVNLGIWQIYADSDGNLVAFNTETKEKTVIAFR